MNRKIVGIGIITLVILSTVSVAEIDYKNKINLEKEKISENLLLESSSNVTIIYEFHSAKACSQLEKDGLSDTIRLKENDNRIIFEKTLNLSKSDLEDIIDELQSLWDQFNKSGNAKEKMKIFINILQIEREVGFIPSSFTLENMNETGRVFSQIFREKILGNQAINQKNNVFTTDLLDFGDPFIGFGSAACIVAPYAQVLPLNIGALLIEVESWELPIFEETTIDFVITIGAAWLELLISHAAAGLGWAISFLPPNAFSWIGPFYSMWGLNTGISLTIYLKSDPIAISLLDMCIWGGATNIILPFRI
jgi:hypothetical protein